MNLTELRAQARLSLRQIRGVFPLFFPPILINFLHLLFAPRSASIEEKAQLNWQEFVRQEVGHQAFPIVLNFIISIFLVSASFALMDLLRHKKESLGLKDAFIAFRSDKLKYVFPVLAVREVLLLFWNGLLSFGSLLTAFSSYKITYVSQQVNLDQGTRNLPKELVQTVNSYGPNLFWGLIILVIGLAIIIPFYYSYSQAVFLLYDQLVEGTYQGSWRLIAQSRKLMRGYKRQRFLLDLSFIIWQLLAFLSMGLANFLVYPYMLLAQIFFYQAIIHKKSD